MSCITHTDLDFADDVALLAEMLSVLVLPLEVMNEKAQPLGLTINQANTKIQTTDVTVPVDTFTYLGSQLQAQVEASMKLIIDA